MLYPVSVAGVRGLVGLPLRPVAALPPAGGGVRLGAGRATAGRHPAGRGGAVPVSGLQGALPGAPRPLRPGLLPHRLPLLAAGVANTLPDRLKD